MSDYSKTVNFAAKDGLSTGDPAKVAKGTEVDTELNNLATAVATKANKVISPNTDYVATLSSAGDLQDSGYIFSELIGDVTVTAAEINTLDGLTATTAEINTLDGITSTVAELNYTDGVTSAIQPQIDAVTPVLSGSIMMWPVVTPPSGYLACSGGVASRTTYAALFAVIGTAYGAGDGSTTFNLPDYRGEFLRGYDGGLGNDPDAASRTNRGDGTTGDVVGSKQAEDYLSHSHSTYTGATNGGSGTTFRNDNGTQNLRYIATGAAGGNETRPRNVSILFVIKT